MTCELAEHACSDGTTTYLLLSVHLTVKMYVIHNCITKKGKLVQIFRFFSPVTQIQHNY